ncbi:MAG: hypothetical protein CMJ67_08695 [Planctomycetaceae bacterium]|nr:hypothetical protein [Planctomycetaceae bacterium]
MTHHFRSFLALTILIAISLVMVGCDDSKPAKNSNTVSSAAIPTAYFTRNRPENVKNLIDVKPTAAVGENIVFLARVGGRVNPFVDGIAIFQVADPGLDSCELMGEEDHCPVPWDYCCEDMAAITAGSATIRIVDESGVALPHSAQGAGGLAPARFLVVDGKVTDKNDEGLFVVDASRIWVGGRPDREDSMKGSRAGEEKVNVDPHDHDFDGIPDHDHDHHDHDHDHDH